MIRTFIITLFILTFNVYPAFSSECNSETVTTLFPILQAEDASKCVEELCDFFNLYKSKRKLCVLNSVARRCVPKVTIGSISPEQLFKDCISDPESLFSIVLKPGSNNEETACSEFNRHFGYEQLGSFEILENSIAH